MRPHLDPVPQVWAPENPGNYIVTAQRRQAAIFLPGKPGRGQGEAPPTTMRQVRTSEPLPLFCLAGNVVLDASGSHIKTFQKLECIIKINFTSVF